MSLSIEQFFREMYESVKAELIMSFGEIGFTNKQYGKLGNGEGIVIVPPAQQTIPRAFFVRTLDENNNVTGIIQAANEWEGLTYSNDQNDFYVQLGKRPGQNHLSIIGPADPFKSYSAGGFASPAQKQHFLNNTVVMGKVQELRLVPASDLNVAVNEGFWIHDGTIYHTNYKVLGDLSAYEPAAGKYKYMFVGIDTNGDGSFVEGDEFDIASIELPSVTAPKDIPDGVHQLGYVRFQEGQTTFAEADFVPLQFVPSVGGGAGVVIPGICQARLTTVTGTPRPTGNNSASSTLYLTEFIGQQINLYNTTSEKWAEHFLTSEISISLSGTASLYGYDVFVYDNAGTLTLEIVSWGSGTSRTTALDKQNGILVKASDHSHLWLGSIHINSGGGTCTQSETIMGVDNHYNKRPYKLRVFEAATFWAYASTTKRGFNNSATCRFYIMNNGYDKHKISLEGRCWGRADSGVISMAIGIGKDSTTVNSAEQFGSYIDSTGGIILSTELEDNPSDGVHYYQLEEWTNGSTGYFSGNGGSANDIRQNFKATAWG